MSISRCVSNWVSDIFFLIFLWFRQIADVYAHL